MRRYDTVWVISGDSRLLLGGGIHRVRHQTE
nr:MAG TPA: LabA-like protein [Caudoviricetes sp.]DAR79751.1 MAG TPA: hypothetical protein [Caudoviricetes sp.]DAV55782.1 MAG TPA: hypothetical protein [Caudoviricetes sp.]